ncbi:MAG: arsenate reductase ArsC [Bacillota bacterium]
MEKIKVLFICVHNSARSQMSEELLKRLGGDTFHVESAGLEPGELNPLAVDAMGKIGYDISNKETNSVFEFYKEGRIYNYVIKVCGESQSERCPIFPGITKTIQWSLDDPSSFEGSYEEKLAKTIKVRDQIKNKVLSFIQNVK